MLVILGIDSQFAMVEVVITSVKDSFEHVLSTKSVRHEFVVLFVCLVSFLAGLPNLFEGGIYFFQIIDYYTAAISLMYIALFETIAIVWLYGVRRLSANIEDMTGRKPSIIFRICWMFVSPVLILVIWVFTLYDYEAPVYGDYVYPWWCVLLGWCIGSSPNIFRLYSNIFPISSGALDPAHPRDGGAGRDERRGQDAV